MRFTRICGMVSFPSPESDMPNVSSSSIRPTNASLPAIHSSKRSPAGFRDSVCCILPLSALDGYEPSIIEADVQGLTAAQVANRVIHARPHYVGITLFTVGVWQAAGLSRRIKAACPDIKILVGGPHISSMGYETSSGSPNSMSPSSGKAKSFSPNCSASLTTTKARGCAQHHLPRKRRGESYPSRKHPRAHG